MKIYVAAPFAAKEYARGVAAQVQKAGHEITSKWLDGSAVLDVGGSTLVGDQAEEIAAYHAQSDLEQVEQSDALLQVTSAAVLWGHSDMSLDRLHSGGRHVEFGYALALNIDTHILGAPENIFTRTMSLHHQSVEEFLEWISTVSLAFSD